MSLDHLTFEIEGVLFRWWFNLVDKNGDEFAVFRTSEDYIDPEGEDDVKFIILKIIDEATEEFDEDFGNENDTEGKKIIKDLAAFVTYVIEHKVDIAALQLKFEESISWT